MGDRGKRQRTATSNLRPTITPEEPKDPPPSRLLGRTCRLRLVHQSDAWLTGTLLNYSGPHKQTCEIELHPLGAEAGAASSGAPRHVEKVHLSTQPVHVLDEVAWGPEGGAASAEGKAAETAGGAVDDVDSCGDSVADGAVTVEVPPPVAEDAHMVKIEVERSCSGWRYVGFDGEGNSYVLTSKDLTDHMVSKPEEYEGKLDRLEFLDGKEFLLTIAQEVYMETGKKAIHFPLVGDEVFVLKASRVRASKIAATS